MIKYTKRKVSQILFTPMQRIESIGSFVGHERTLFGINSK